MRHNRFILLCAILLAGVAGVSRSQDLLAKPPHVAVVTYQDQTSITGKIDAADFLIDDPDGTIVRQAYWNAYRPRSDRRTYPVAFKLAVVAEIEFHNAASNTTVQLINGRAYRGRGPTVKNLNLKTPEGRKLIDLQQVERIQFEHESDDFDFNIPGPFLARPPDLAKPSIFLRASGSTTVSAIISFLGDYYSLDHPDVQVTVEQSGSGHGIKSLLQGKCQIAMSSRPLKERELALAASNQVTPMVHLVAYEALAFVVHADNPVKNLSKDQLRGIYTGSITNWTQVGGPNESIAVLHRDTSSQTAEVFVKTLMYRDGQRIKGKWYLPGNNSVKFLGSNGAVRQKLEDTPNGIGYVTLGFLNGNISPVQVNGVACTTGNIRSAKYPMARPHFLVTNGYPVYGSHLHRLTTLHLSRVGHKMIEDMGFIPVTDYNSREEEASNKAIDGD